MVTPVFSSSECVISRVLSSFYLSEGGTPFLCFVVLATVVLLNAVVSRVLAWFWVEPRKDRAFIMTLFLGVSQSWIVRVFWAGFEWSWCYIVCVCVLRLVFALKLWSFVAVMHACRRWR